MIAKLFIVFNRRILQGHEKNLWVEYSALAIRHQAVNLGQGFPDFPPPDFLKDAWSEAVNVPSAHWSVELFGIF